jgi:putative flippase GtrA
VRDCNKMFYDFFRRITGFGIVGIVATFVHSFFVVFFVEFVGVPPLLSTVLAFLLSVFISYGGNRYWVFKDRPFEQYQLSRFFLVAIMSFILNFSGMFVVVNLLYLSYLWGVFLGLVVVPLLTFFMHNFWSFRYEER